MFWKTYIFGNLTFPKTPVLDLMSLPWSRLRAAGANTFSKTYFSGVEEGPKGPKWHKLAQMGPPVSRLRAAGTNTFSKTDMSGN